MNEKKPTKESKVRVLIVALITFFVSQVAVSSSTWAISYIIMIFNLDWLSEFGFIPTVIFAEIFALAITYFLLKEKSYYGWLFGAIISIVPLLLLILMMASGM
jgi:hypothetical protein